MTHFSEKFLYLFLGALAIFSWWLAEYSGFVEAVRVKPSAEHPDYFSKGYSKWEMDETGKLKSKLVAEEMEHFAAYWATHTKKPIMEFINPTTPPWVVTAETGLLSNDGLQLQLNGKVNINRAKAEGVKQLIINTSQLLVNPQTSYAETKAWAELISPPNITTGTGLKATFKEPVHLQLLSQVKGKYETK